jgi:hypothetical protein
MEASFPPECHSALAANVPPDQVLLGGSVNPVAPVFQAASEGAPGRATPGGRDASYTGEVARTSSCQEAVVL